MGNVSKRGWSFGISGCAGCPFFVLFHREKVWRGLHLDGKKFWKRQKTRVWDEKSFWKFSKKFSLRVLFWPQFGEKTGVRGTVEEGLGEFWGGNAQRIFQKYFECFFFSLPPSAFGIPSTEGAYEWRGRSTGDSWIAPTKIFAMLAPLRKLYYYHIKTKITSAKPPLSLCWYRLKFSLYFIYTMR